MSFRNIYWVKEKILKTKMTHIKVSVLMFSISRISLMDPIKKRDKENNSVIIFPLAEIVRLRQNKHRRSFEDLKFDLCSLLKHHFPLESTRKNKHSKNYNIWKQHQIRIPKLYHQRPPGWTICCLSLSLPGWPASVFISHTGTSKSEHCVKVHLIAIY